MPEAVQYIFTTLKMHRLIKQTKYVKENETGGGKKKKINTNGKIGVVLHGSCKTENPSRGRSVTSLHF